MASSDAITLLKNDHREAKRLFREFRATSERAHATRRRILDRIITELTTHAGIEETIFYPQIRNAIPESGDEILESLEEHHVVKLLLRELEGMDPRDERFTPKVTVLMENVEHHIGEEEEELFPQVRGILGRRELQTMGVEMESARAVVPKRPHPRMPNEPPGNIAAAAVAAPVDVVIAGTRVAAERGMRIVRDAIPGRES